ncbi:helix-turn-helix transcriptional regulator [Mesorhizobium sp. ASY16-5R]|uniref:helix-turn-helix transcriptional regulator n=1 Tax=Mesorhizobium sp. ASY16-5R TaxID=3445772 RepID=UPI003FA04E0E
MNIATEPRPEREYLPARGVWERYGKSSMTLHRWLADERMNFPKPVYFGRFRFWRLSELETWERQQVAKSREAA